MWHIEPDSRFAVSIKRNADQHSHAECGAHGYRNIEPWMKVALPAIQPGEPVSTCDPPDSSGIAATSFGPQDVQTRPRSGLVGAHEV